MTPKALVVDEWSVLRGGLAAVLTSCGVKVVGQAARVADAVAALRRDPCDVVLLGLVGRELAAVDELQAVVPDAAIILLLHQPDRSFTIAAFESGAAAVLTRDATEPELRDAVMRVVRGERFASPGLLAGLFGRSAPPAEATGLTERERAVLAELAQGHSNREIAGALFIGEATVKTHLRNIYDKLDVTNRVQAVGRAIELNLV